MDRHRTYAGHILQFCHNFTTLRHPPTFTLITEKLYETLRDSTLAAGFFKATGLQIRHVNFARTNKRKKKKNNNNNNNKKRNENKNKIVLDKFVGYDHFTCTLSYNFM
ncbi:hypothetical protein ElyMa_003774800 [Elysia marginata]|uniref:Uncharacterized protein n=1 Tax=Elysia marginata TaxID=1093978 RepID=A0AAV4FBJ6_9GAST|nr:hypothetical protein ElyMa_003774800 [Elysia marginata]